MAEEKKETRKPEHSVAKRKEWPREMLVEELLKIARNDLEASRLLFEKRLYPHAVFFLQQSVEKAVKSLAIHDGIISQAKAKDLRHDPVRIYAEIIKHWKQFGSAIKSSGIREVLPEFNVFSVVRDLPEQDVEFEKILAILGDASRAYKSVFLSEGKIDQFLTKVAEVRDKIENAKRELDIEKEWAMKKEQIKQLLGILDKIDPEHPRELEQVKADMMRELDKTPQAEKDAYRFYLCGLLDLSFCDISLLYLSLILLPHAIYSRYPEGEIHPLEIYVEEFPLIKKFDQIALLIKEILTKINNSFSHVPSGPVISKQ